MFVEQVLMMFGTDEQKVLMMFGTGADDGA